MRDRCFGRFVESVARVQGLLLLALDLEADRAGGDGADDIARVPVASGGLPGFELDPRAAYPCELGSPLERSVEQRHPDDPCICVHGDPPSELAFGRVDDPPHATLAELPDRLGGDAFEVRRWRAEDAPRLHSAVLESLEHLRPWMPWIAEEPVTLSQRRERIETWLVNGERGGDLVVGVFAGTAVAGGAGLHHRIGPGALEIGYWTHPAYLRRGAATTAARLLTDAAFSVEGIDRVEIHHDRANTGSAGVPRGLGFDLTAETPDAPTAPAEIGIECTWTMTRRQWESRGLRS